MDQTTLTPVVIVCSRSVILNLIQDRLVNRVLG